MFKIDHSDLIIGKNLWVFEVDESALINKTEPQLYEFIGGDKDSEGRLTSLFLKDLTVSTVKNIPCVFNGYAPNENTLETHNYIIAPRRTRVIEIIKNVACRPALNEMMNGIPKQYLALLEEYKPELLI